VDRWQLNALRGLGGSPLSSRYFCPDFMDSYLSALVSEANVVS
jgi:hypothetical protein